MQRAHLHSLTIGFGKCCGSGQRGGTPGSTTGGLKIGTGIREMEDNGRLGLILYQMTDMPIVRMKSLDLNKNPYLDRDYFAKRKEEHRMKRNTAYQKSTAARSGYYAL